MLRMMPENTSIDFLSKRKICAILSSIFLLVTVLLLGFKGLNWGIDFAGGTLVQVKTEKQVEIATLRKAILDVGIEGATLQEFEGSGGELLVRVPEKDSENANATVTAEKVEKALNTVAGGVEVRRVEFVGPQIGDELRITGLIALLLSMAAILVYISIRFEMRYAIGAIAALGHDILLTVGAFAFLQKEVTMTVLAALLTIIGYSLNDTIVVFDRVRENIAKQGKMTLRDILNLSVNEMLNRTLMTSVTTLVVLLALFLFGGGVIHDFAFTLMFGVIVGTYSSVFVAAPVVLAMEGYYQRLKEKEAETPGFMSSTEK
ncbi:MAG: protein translocase subunit SecF [Magnetococcales bacterium]|nr:protein translocase subunit SecF [Magnetococcales bacterium]|tara:strand:+ start:3041 stop:3994 length:954 start_codon:yes stop_codon:yes gene_type:complete